MLALLQFGLSFILYQGFIQGFSKDLFVSHGGEDFLGCGHPASPCASVRFTVENVSLTDDVINIDNDKDKPYTECTSSDSKSIRITKSLSFVGMNGKAVIDCNPQHTLFVISGNKVITVRFKNLLFTNAKNAIVHEFSSSSLHIKSCIFRKNRIAINLSTTNCLLHVFNSTFEDNFVLGIRAADCDSIRANLTSNVFDSSSVMILPNHFHPMKFLQVFVSRCSFTEQEDTNRHATVKPTKLLAIMYHTILEVLDIIINCSRFAQFNRDNWNNVSALAINHLRGNPRNNTKASIRLTGLIFESISCRSTAVVLYDAYLPRRFVFVEVRNCIFHNNANAALRITVRYVRTPCTEPHEGPYVVFKNNSFTKNRYINQPDASFSDLSTLCLLTGTFFVVSCHFSDNSQGSSSTAAAIYVGNQARVIFRDCYFENSQVHGTALQILAQPQSVVVFNGKNAFNMLNLMVNQKIVHIEPTVGNGYVPTEISVEVSKTLTVQCPKGYSFQSRNRTAGPFKLRHSDLFHYLSISCLQCPGKTYSLERGAMHNRTESKIKCNDCPRGGWCENGKVQAKRNFWGYKNQKQIFFVPCPSGYCCQNDNCESYSSCYGKRTGTLCNRCPKNMSESLFSTTCKANETCQAYTFWVGFSTLLSLSFLFFLFHTEITTFLQKGLSFKRDQRARSPRYHEIRDQFSNFSQEDRSTSEGIGYFKIIFYYYQIVHILKGTVDSSEQSNPLSTLQYQATKVFNFIVVRIGIFDCSFQSLTPIKKAVLLHSMGFGLLTLSILTCLLWEICKLVKKCKTTTSHINVLSENTAGSLSDAQRINLKVSRKFQLRILCAFINISLLMYSSTTQLVFTLLQCVPLKDYSVLFIDGTVQCYQPFQQTLLAYAVGSTLPFFLVPFLGSYILMDGTISVFQFCLACLFPLPFCCYWCYLLIAKQSNSQQIEVSRYFFDTNGNAIPIFNEPSRKAVVNLLSGPFRPHDKFLCFPSSRLPWESVLILRRLIILVAFTFIYDSRLRMMVILTICVTVLISHLYVKPFKNAKENFLETISLGILIILCGFTLVKALLQGEDYSSFSSSLQLLEKFNLTESILILAPATFLILVATLHMLMKLVFLVLSFGSSLCRKFRNWFN